jgi:hypothetical protein
LYEDFVLGVAQIEFRPVVPFPRRSCITDRADNPAAKVGPLVRRANRTAVGSLAGQLDLSGDWDSSQTNAEIAADFGIGA